MNSALGQGYTSRSQMARVITEDWVTNNLYCCACDSGTLTQAPANRRAIDFTCPRCASPYQLKGRSTWSESRVIDAGYEAMMQAIRTGTTPNLLVMHYAPNWSVRNLLLVPSFFFSASAVEKRNPLGPNARRAGYVGCNILLSAIAPEGKLRVVDSGAPVPPADVREWYQKVKPLSGLDAGVRGWTLDVLRFVRALGKAEFTLAEVYSFEGQLAALHPGNNNVRAKIRQQLQCLRDLDFLEFGGRGHYRLLI